MAPRLFPRNPKKAPEEATQFEAGADDQASVSQIPFVALQDPREPGWYPDTADSGLMRYWDGFHFTGQAKRASSPSSSTADAQEGVQVAVPPTTDIPSSDSDPDITGLDAPTRSQPVPGNVESPAIEGLNENHGPTSPITVWPPLYVAESSAPAGRSRSVASHSNSESTIATSSIWLTPREAGSETEEDEIVETHVVAQADDDSVSDRNGHRGKENLMDSSFGQSSSDGVSNWGKDTEQAVARALTVDTPEAWQEAAHVAAVVSEMAQTMQSAADAKQTERETAKAAEEAEEAARVAGQTAVEAKETAERMAKAAEEAADAARVAAQTAVEAKAAAERSALVAPEVAEMAAVASRTAADAKKKANALEQVVATARAANTAAAWSEALGQTAVAVEAKPTGAEVSAEPVSGSTPPPVMWKQGAPLGGSGAESLDQVLGIQTPNEPKDRLSQGLDAFGLGGPQLAPHLTEGPGSR
jgi:hypothetical protein